MATNHADIAAPIGTVWAVLADPRQYAHFVVGTKEVRHFDPAWPDDAAHLHHSIGFGAAVLRDRTSVVAAEPPSSLRLRAGMGPLGVSVVVFSLEPEGSATTRVTLDEGPVEGPAHALWNPVLDALLAIRNVEVLRRLRHLAERRASTTVG